LRKAADRRDSGGPFKSAEDFRYRLGLTMDQLVPLKSVISMLRVPVKSTNPKVKPGGRIVDVWVAARFRVFTSWHYAVCINNILESHNSGACMVIGCSAWI